jgi:hypothetical protein
VAKPLEESGDGEHDAAWRRERLESLARLGSAIATLGWIVSALGLLLAVRLQALLSQVSAQASTRLEALALPLLVCSFGVGLAAFGQLLRIVPVIYGSPAPTPTGRPRSLAVFLRTMRSHQG